MTVYAWPTGTGWMPSRFEMRIAPNTRTFTGPYTPTVQSIDLLGERWQASVDLPPDVDAVAGASREAYFDRLKGPVNQVSLYHFARPVPNGTLRDGVAVNVINASSVVVPVKNASNVTVPCISGQPALRSAAAQGANTATLSCVPGVTLKAGDHIGLGTGGQLVRVMADAAANGSGNMTIEFQPRARTAIAACTLIVWNKPTANFILKDTPNVPTTWRAGSFDGASVDFIEAL